MLIPITKFLALFFFIFLIQSPCFSFVILIDPGHGGKEQGAVSKVWAKGKKKKLRNIYEKDLTLILAKKVKKILEKTYTVYLTRSYDRAIGLVERAKKAELVKADLFISIHFNSGEDYRFGGFETFYLDNHKNQAVKRVEDLENKHWNKKNKEINKILIDLIIAKTVVHSKKLASFVHHRVQQYIGKKFKIKDRGIKPGLFYVLALAKRPSILIEAGFMSNNQELKLIRSGRYLNRYALAIADGIIDFLKQSPQKRVPLF